MADAMGGRGVPGLEPARALAGARDWRALAAWADEAPVEALVAQPELAYLVADALRRVGRMEESLPLAREAERRARRDADRRLALRSLNLLGMIHFEAGRMAEAGAAFEALLNRATDWGDDEFAARASNNLGVLANVRGYRELALTAYQRALAAYHRLGYRRGLAQTHYNLGISYRDLGFPDKAESYYALALAHAEAAESEDVVALVETERAWLRAGEGDGVLAESIAARARARLERMGDPIGAANALRVLAAAARARGDLDLAAERLERTLHAARQLPDLLLRAEVQRDRGTLLLERGDSLAAADALRDALEAFHALGAEAEAGAVRRLLATTPLPPDASV